jgi:transposase
MGISQRWLVIYSQAAKDRSQKTINKQVKRAKDKLEKDLFHLQAQRFACETDANKALDKWAKKLKYHQIADRKCIAHQKYKGKGRPTKNTPVETLWQITATFCEHKQAIEQALEQKSCFVLATNVNENELDDETILQRYKAQSTVERGFRFLKDPLFFVSSLFLKKPSRIDALLMVMLLSLLVYSIAQRRMRVTMKRYNATVPSQINQPNPSPTLRWMFQCFEGINLVQTSEKYEYSSIFLDGMDELRLRVVTYLGDRVAWLYKNKNFEMAG